MAVRKRHRRGLRYPRLRRRGRQGKIRRFVFAALHGKPRIYILRMPSAGARPRYDDGVGLAFRRANDRRKKLLKENRLKLGVRAYQGDCQKGGAGRRGLYNRPSFSRIQRNILPIYKEYFCAVQRKETDTRLLLRLLRIFRRGFYRQLLRRIQKAARIRF